MSAHAHSTAQDDELFAWQNTSMDLVRARGMQEYVRELGDVSAAFTLQDRTVRCIDEGTPGGIHFAGSGILPSFEDALAWMKAARVDGVTSHAGCGAAGLYASREGFPADAATTLGQQHAEKLASALGVPYVAHITDLQRPAHMHDARVAYYDGTGSFDPAQVEGLPKGFVVSRRWLDPAYAVEEMKVACSIALGDHGFGDRFTAEHPFLLIAVADDAAGLLSLQEELAPVVALHGGRVALDGLTAASRSH